MGPDDKPDVSLGQGSEEDAWRPPDDFDHEKWQAELRELDEDYARRLRDAGVDDQ